MAKILISFVGTGRPVENSQKNEESSKRQYETALYRVSADGEPIESSFASKAIAQAEKIDSLFLIGTTHSMWEEVYRTFCSESVFNEDIWAELADFCEKAGPDNELKLPKDCQKAIEDAMGVRSKVVLVHYGRNDDEIKKNLDIVLSLRDYLKHGDEIVVDVTHAFRSIPLSIMNLLIYLRTVQSPKVTISHIYYAMLEWKDSKRVTPLVDMRSVLDITDWTIGAYSFKMSGDSRGICDLLGDSQKKLRENLTRFSSLLSLNYLGPLQEETKRLNGLKNYEYASKIEELTIKPVIDDYIREFGRFDEPQEIYKFQYKLAKWQYEHFNLLASMTTLLEALISYECVMTEKLKGKGPFNFEAREEAKKMLKNESDPDLKAIFSNINRLRNTLVHQNAQRQNKNYGDCVNAIESSLRSMSKIFNIK